MNEHVPGNKTSLAITSEFIQGYHIADLLGSVHINARHYEDSWALIAHDAELQWYQHFTDESYVRLRARIYHQGATGFSKEVYTGDEVYHSPDIRYYKFSSFTLGAKIMTSLFETWHDNVWLPDRFDISYDYGMRDTYGDQGTSRPFAHYQLFPSTEYYTQGTFMLGLGFDL